MDPTENTAWIFVSHASAGQTNEYDQGKISNGKINGNNLTFVRHSYDSSGSTQSWIATTSMGADGRLRMLGSMDTILGPCKFEGTKLVAAR